MSLQTVGTIVGILGGIAGLVALFLQWAQQVGARRTRLRQYAKEVVIRREIKGRDAFALWRNGSDRPLLDVVINVTLDPLSSEPPPGLTLDDFAYEVHNAHVALGDKGPNPPEKTFFTTQIGSQDFRVRDSDRALAFIRWKPRPDDYVPSALTPAKVAEIMQNASHDSAERMIRRRAYPGLKFSDERARARWVYEHFCPRPCGTPLALKELSIDFTDPEYRRWRRHENGSIVFLGPSSRLTRLLQLPTTLRADVGSTAGGLRAPDSGT